MSRQNVLKKNFPSATCKHCNKVTDIQFSNDWRKIITKYKTMSELAKTKDKNLVKWMDIKNGQIQAMHKTIAKLLGLLDDEQREKARKISQEMRDSIRKAEKDGNI